MAMGRKPKPTHLKLVTGNPGRRPLSAVEAQAVPALPPPPPPQPVRCGSSYQSAVTTRVVARTWGAN